MDYRRRGRRESPPPRSPHGSKSHTDPHTWRDCDLDRSRCERFPPSRRYEPLSRFRSPTPNCRRQNLEPRRSYFRNDSYDYDDEESFIDSDEDEYSDEGYSHQGKYADPETYYPSQQHLLDELLSCFDRQPLVHNQKPSKLSAYHNREKQYPQGVQDSVHYAKVARTQQHSFTGKQHRSTHTHRHGREEIEIDRQGIGVPSKPCRQRLVHQHHHRVRHKPEDDRVRYSANHRNQQTCHREKPSSNINQRHLQQDKFDILLDQHNSTKPKDFHVRNYKDIKSRSSEKKPSFSGDFCTGHIPQFHGYPPQGLNSMNAPPIEQSLSEEDEDRRRRSTRVNPTQAVFNSPSQYRIRALHDPSVRPQPDAPHRQQKFDQGRRHVRAEFGFHTWAYAHGRQSTNSFGLGFNECKLIDGPPLRISNCGSAPQVVSHKKNPEQLKHCDTSIRSVALPQQGQYPSHPQHQSRKLLLPHNNLVHQQFSSLQSIGPLNATNCSNMLCIKVHDPTASQIRIAELIEEDVPDQNHRKEDKLPIVLGTTYSNFGVLKCASIDLTVKDEGHMPPKASTPDIIFGRVKQVPSEFVDPFLSNFEEDFGVRNKALKCILRELQPIHHLWNQVLATLWCIVFLVSSYLGKIRGRIFCNPGRVAYTTMTIFCALMGFHGIKLEDEFLSSGGD